MSKALVRYPSHAPNFEIRAFPANKSKMSRLEVFCHGIFRNDTNKTRRMNSWQQSGDIPIACSVLSQHQPSLYTPIAINLRIARSSFGAIMAVRL